MLKFKPVILSVILLSILTIFVGCGDESQGSASSKAWLAAGTVNCNATTNSIQTQGDRNLTCTATILTQGDTEWCSFDLASSVLETTVAVGKPIYIYMKKNTAASDREATLRVLFSDGYTADFTMTQTSFSVSADYDRAWGEQPLYRAEADYVYKPTIRPCRTASAYATTPSATTSTATSRTGSPIRSMRATGPAAATRSAVPPRGAPTPGPTTIRRPNTPRRAPTTGWSAAT